MKHVSSAKRFIEVCRPAAIVLITNSLLASRVDRHIENDEVELSPERRLLAPISIGLDRASVQSNIRRTRDESLPLLMLCPLRLCFVVKISNQCDNGAKRCDGNHDTCTKVPKAPLFQVGVANVF